MKIQLQSIIQAGNQCKGGLNAFLTYNFLSIWLWDFCNNNLQKGVFGHPFSTYEIRKTNISYPLIRTHTCAFSGGKKC